MNKTILKARYGSELRKNWIHHNNDMSFNDLVAKMQRYFGIRDGTSIKLKYRDEEKDWITLTDDDDLHFALVVMDELYVDVIAEEEYPSHDNAKEETIAKEAIAAAVGEEKQTGYGQQSKKHQMQNQFEHQQLTEVPLNGTATTPVMKPPTPQNYQQQQNQHIPSHFNSISMGKQQHQFEQQLTEIPLNENSTPPIMQPPTPQLHQQQQQNHQLPSQQPQYGLGYQQQGATNNQYGMGYQNAAIQPPPISMGQQQQAPPPPPIGMSQQPPSFGSGMSAPPPMQPQPPVSAAQPPSMGGGAFPPPPASMGQMYQQQAPQQQQLYDHQQQQQHYDHQPQQPPPPASHYGGMAGMPPPPPISSIVGSSMAANPFSRQQR